MASGNKADGLPRLTKPKKTVDKVLTEKHSEGTKLLSKLSEVRNEEQLAQLDREFWIWSDWNKQYLEHCFSNRSIAENYEGRFAGGFVPFQPPPLSKKVEELRELVQDKLDELQKVINALPIYELEGKTLRSGVKETLDDGGKRTEQTFEIFGINPNVLFASVCGMALILIVLFLAFFVHDPSELQANILRIVLALACGGFGAAIPGILDVQISNVIKAGGALAVFIVVYFWNPAHVTPTTNSASPIQVPVTATPTSPVTQSPPTPTIETTTSAPVSEIQQPKFIFLKTSDGRESESFEADRRKTGIGVGPKERIVTFVLPEGYKRKDFAPGIDRRPAAGKNLDADGSVEWFSDDPYDARIKLRVWADALSYCEVTVSGVRAERESPSATSAQRP